jgi:hypothetical protein
LALNEDEESFSYVADALSASTPASYHEAKDSGEWDKWKPAMDTELDQCDVVLT